MLLVKFLWLCLLSSFTRAVSVHKHDSSFIPDHVLSVTHEEVSLGCELRMSTVINGSVPGPVLHLHEGQTSWIRIYNNQPTQNLTMHWHGLSASVAPFSDGAPQATQWPIPASHYFDYELHPNVGEAGTYFYHSHFEFQAVTATGALIVHEPNIPYQYDEEKVIILSDYFNKTDENIIEGLTTAKPFRWSGEPNAVLINGKQRPVNSTAPDSCSLEHIDVEPGKTYRLRFIGATSRSVVQLAFEGHESLSLIEIDGGYIQPHETSFLQIASGQRYSILLKTKSREELSQSSRKTDFFMELQTIGLPVTTTEYAVLRYSTETKIPTPPCSPLFVLNETVHGWLDYEVSPLRPNGFPPNSEVTRQITLSVHQLINNPTGNLVLWTVDEDTPWMENFPRTPYLVALYKNDFSALPDWDRAQTRGGFDPVVRAFPARIGEVIDITLQTIGVYPNGTGDLHPFHLHGAHFWDLGSGNLTYDGDAREKNLAYWDGKKEPIRRDTSMLYRPAPYAPNVVGAGWRAWRIRVTDPGVWMLHCHTLQHMIMGMQSVFVFGDSHDIKTVPIPLVHGYLDYGGGAYGNTSYDPDVTHFWDSSP